MQHRQTGAVPRGDRRQCRRWRAFLAALAFALAGASVPVAAWAIPAGAPPTQEEESDEPTAGEIIADGRARLPRGDVAWTLRTIDIPAGESLAVEEFPTGFVLVDEGTVALRAEDDEEPTELTDGEADVFPDRKAGTIANQGDAPATLYEIALVPARDAASDDPTDEPSNGTPPAVVGEPFTAPEGETFQIELVRNTLTGDDEATIPVAASGAPTVFLATEGTAQLQAGAQVVDLTPGQFALLAGEVQVRAADDEPAAYVVAAIGEEAEARAPGDREPREERPREPRQRAAGGGGGGGQAALDRGSRRAARQAARQAQQAQQGQGGGGGGGGQAQQPGAGGPVGGGGDATATIPAPGGTPPAEPTAEPTLPTDPTAPADGTPPPAETTPPATETPAATETPIPIETPTPEPTVFVPPTNPPVPDVPGVPTVPPAETAPPAAPPAEEPPPAEETPAPVEEEAVDPAADA